MLICISLVYILVIPCIKVALNLIWLYFLKKQENVAFVAILGQEWLLIYIPELHNIQYLFGRIWSERLLVGVKGPEDVQYLLVVVQPVNSLAHLCLWYFFSIGLNQNVYNFCIVHTVYMTYCFNMYSNCHFSVFLNQDGRIDYGEFVAMMTKGNMGVGRRTMRNSLNISMRDTPAGALWSLSIQEICCSMRERLVRAAESFF